MEREAILLFFDEEAKQSRSSFIFFWPIFILFCLTILILAVPVSLFFLLLVGPLPLQSLWGLLALFLLSIIAALSFWYYLSSYGFLDLLYLLGARPLNSRDYYHQVLEHIVEEMAVSCGLLGKITPFVIPTKAINGASVSSRDNHFICITEGAISTLTRAQLQALVAHCIAKIGLRESKFATLGSSMLYFFHTLQYFWIGKILFYPLVHLALSLLARSDIYRCDAAAVRLTRDPQSLAEVLYLGTKSFEQAREFHSLLIPLFTIPPFHEILSPSLESRLDKLQKMGAQTSPEILDHKRINTTPLVDDISQEEMQQKWYVLKEEKEWKGPFSAKELFSQEWFHPELWVRLESEEFHSPAYAHPEMFPYFHGKLPTTSIKCPNCGNMFIQKKVVGLDIQQCLHCKGILIFESQLLPLLARKGRISPPETLKQWVPKSWEDVKNNPEYRKLGRVCPYCRDLMRNFPYSLAYPIALDKCENCSRIWLDAGELEILEDLLEANKIGDMVSLSEGSTSLGRKEDLKQGVIRFGKKLGQATLMGIAYLVVFSPLVLPFADQFSWKGIIISSLFIILTGLGVGFFLPANIFSPPVLYLGVLGGTAGAIILLAATLPIKIVIPLYALFSLLFALWFANSYLKVKKEDSHLQEHIKSWAAIVYLSFPIFVVLFALSLIILNLLYPIIQDFSHHSPTYTPIFLFGLIGAGALVGASIGMIFFNFEPESPAFQET